MKSSKILGLAVASILGTASVSSFAAVLGTDTPFKYASELVTVEAGTAITLPSSVLAQLKASLPTGSSESRYVRIDLTGLTFVGAVGGSDSYIASDTTPTRNDSASVQLSSGGQADSAFAIYTVTNTGTTAIPQTQYFNFVPATTLKLTGTSPTIQYRLYETETCAQNPTATVGSCGLTLASSGALPLISLASGIDMVMESASETAYVKQSYKSFNKDADDFGAELGSVQIKATGALNSSGSSAVVSEILSSSSKLVIKGNFSAYGSTAGKAWLDTTSGSCGDSTSNYSSASDFAATNMATDKQSADFAVGNSTSAYYLCLHTDETSEIPASSYTVDLVPSAAGSANVTGINQKDKTIGTIKRDGVILRSGFVSKFGIGTSRFVLVNSSSTDAYITGVKLFGNTYDAVNKTYGTANAALKSTFTMPYLLKANSRTYLPLSELTDLASMPNANVSVELQIGAQDDDISGTYQLLLGGSDVQTVVPMERPVSSYSQPAIDHFNTP